MYEYHEWLNILRNQTEFNKGQGSEVTDMDLIVSQALLMDAGSATLKAIKSGELAEILLGLVRMAYRALAGLTLHNDADLDAPATMPNDYLMLAIMRQLSKNIAGCASGSPKDYSSLFCYCAHLSTDFINADFDKAMHIYHQWRIAQPVSNRDDPNNKFPDLSGCLFE